VYVHAGGNAARSERKFMTIAVILDGAPMQESCVKVGTPQYVVRAQCQCYVLIEQLRRAFGSEPTGVRLTIRHVPHHLGTFLIVAALVDPSIPHAIAFVEHLQSNFPIHWDLEAQAGMRSLFNKWLS
jgi:hypothetical protein